MKYKKNGHYPYTVDNINALVEKYKISTDVAEILLERGIATDAEIDKFLNPKLSNLHDPFLFNDMDKVVARIKKAIENKESVLIFGDYDVDGITSSYILLDYFRSVGLDVNTFLPNRYSDGYGLTRDAVDYVLNTFKPSLIITVDCGISGYEEVEYIKSKGVDIIVTDHHEINNGNPPAYAVINPKREDNEFPYKYLAGVGTAFMLIYALFDKLGKKEDLYKYLDIVAIGTVADKTAFGFVKGFPFLSDPVSAWIVIVLTTLWWTVGNNMVILNAGIKQVDKSLYEAAAIDGCGELKSIIHITIPQIANQVLICSITTIIASFNVYGQSQLITTGGPDDATMMFIQRVLEMLKLPNRGVGGAGIANAMCVLFALIILAISLIQLYVTRDKKDSHRRLFKKQHAYQKTEA